MTIFRLTRLAGMALLAAVVATAATAKADSISFIDASGLTTANGSRTGNINTATTFGFGNLITVVGGSGVFAGLPTQSFGPVSFNITNPGGFVVSNSVFGTFTSTSISEVVNIPGFVNFLVTGHWTPGSFFGGLAGGTATFAISFNQSPASTGDVASAVSFAFTPAETVVPEPASIVLLGSGLLGLAGFARRRSAKK